MKICPTYPFMIDFTDSWIRYVSWRHTTARKWFFMALKTASLFFFLSKPLMFYKKKFSLRIQNLVFDVTGSWAAFFYFFIYIDGKLPLLFWTLAAKSETIIMECFHFIYSVISLSFDDSIVYKTFFGKHCFRPHSHHVCALNITYTLNGYVF